MSTNEVLLLLIYFFVQQAFVHKSVMDELKRIIEDSEVCDVLLFLPLLFCNFLLKLSIQSVRTLTCMLLYSSFGISYMEMGEGKGLNISFLPSLAWVSTLSLCPSCGAFCPISSTSHQHTNIVFTLFLSLCCSFLPLFFRVRTCHFL